MTKNQVWFLTGSQHLYGKETLDQVQQHSKEIVAHLSTVLNCPIEVNFKSVLTTAEEITATISEANHSVQCIGLIAWMHTFSPAKMWINGLRIMHKPLLHLHTQFNRDIPWNKIDMDFMNLNQSAHGDREFGHILTRMNIRRTTVVGHYSDPQVITEIGNWCRVAMGWADWQQARIVRFGDNMRFVAVTEGDKVEAQIRFGFTVNTHGIGDLSAYIDDASEKDIDRLCEEYVECYQVDASLLKTGKQHTRLREAAAIEHGLTAFLMDGNYKGFTTTFEDLHGLKQLPGLAVQRLMAAGFGFAAEGDWKTAALVRLMKTMSIGREGGNSFMEDYTYHLEPGNERVLGAHMLEICPTISNEKPKCSVHPLSIGGKADPVRLIFNGSSGPAVNVSLVDLGDRFRLLANEVVATDPQHQMPELPVARLLWQPLPDFHTACRLWLEAGGAHHTCFSQNVSVDMIRTLANISGVELVHIR